MGIYLEGFNGMAKDQVLRKHGIPMSVKDLIDFSQGGYFEGDVPVCAIENGWLACAILWNRSELNRFMTEFKILTDYDLIDSNGRLATFWLVEKEVIDRFIRQ